MKKMKVLIVDDALLVLTRVSDIINELDCVSDVLMAFTYQDAINKVASARPDVVLLDIHLRDKSGIELLDFIKRNYPSVKTIVLTNQVHNNYRNLCEKIGSDHFIDKSSEFERISGILQSFCA